MILRLVEGKIPAYTACPWAQRCELKQSNACHHRGIEHAVPFSCAVARGFELIEDCKAKN